jgi:drug/metabolite transporter (DMT)-like permease
MNCCGGEAPPVNRLSPGELASGRKSERIRLADGGREGARRGTGSQMSTDEGQGGEETSGGEGIASGAAEADYRAYLYVALMVVLGSTTAAAAKFIVRELPVAWLPVVRFGTAGLCLLPLLRERGVLGRILRKDGALIVLAAALCVPVNQGFFLNATRLGPTAHVGLFYATCPLVVLLLAWALRLERPDLGRLWGILASVVGVVVIGVGSAWQAGGFAAETRSVMLADGLLIGAVLSWGAYLTVSKPLIMRHGSLPVLTATFLLGFLLDLPIALATAPALPPLGQVSLSAWLALAFLTLFITPVNLACQNLALRRLDASQVANFSNIAPSLTVAWGAWLFGEALTPSLVLGGTLTLGGVLWTSRPRASEGCRWPGAGGPAVVGERWSVIGERKPGRPRVLPAVSPDYTGS